MEVDDDDDSVPDALDVLVSAGEETTNKIKLKGGGVGVPREGRERSAVVAVGVAG